jgi:hypothetical protein
MAEQTKTQQQPPKQSGPVYVLSQFNAPHGISIKMSPTNRKGRISLNPGVNAVEPDDWAQAEKNAMVQLYMSRDGKRRIQVLGTQALEDLSTDAALDLVEKTFTEALLKQWAKTETRDAVKDAIETQLAAIDPRRKS